MWNNFLFLPLFCLATAERQCLYDHDPSSDDLPPLIIANRSDTPVINSKVISCLKNSPYAASVYATEWRVPQDAQKHYDELLKATAKYR